VEILIAPAQKKKKETELCFLAYAFSPDTNTHTDVIRTNRQNLVQSTADRNKITSLIEPLESLKLFLFFFVFLK